MLVVVEEAMLGPTDLAMSKWTYCILWSSGRNWLR